MKLKKLFAGIVAVAMMATMAIPGFAAGTVTKNSTVDATDKTVNITVKYEGSGFGSDKIKLALDATDAGKPYAIKNSSIKNVTAVADKTIHVLPTDTDVTEATSGATTATLTVSLPDYTNVGTYFYKLAQVEGKTAGMTYDTEQLYLMVNVVNEKEDLSTNKFEYKVALFKGTDPTTYTTETALGNAKIECLTNKYTNGQFTVRKEVKGNMADRNETFNFRVIFENTTTDKGTIPAMKVDGKAFGTDSIEALTWADNKASYDFTLKHGVTVTFSNIPAGMKITVTERNSDNTADVANNTPNGEYTATYDDVAKTGVTISKEVTNGAAVITNTSNVHPNTGVILDNAPYIALLTIVAAGAVVMIMKKRRNYED